MKFLLCEMKFTVKTSRWRQRLSHISHLKYFSTIMSVCKPSSASLRFSRINEMHYVWNNESLQIPNPFKTTCCVNDNQGIDMKCMILNIRVTLKRTDLDVFMRFWKFCGRRKGQNRALQWFILFVWSKSCREICVPSTNRPIN